MPRKHNRVSISEQAEHSETCHQLKELGIEIPSRRIPKPRHRFSLEPIYPELARVHDLPDGSVAVTLPAKLTILNSGVMFTEALVLPEWDDWPLELEMPSEHRYFNDFMQDFPTFPPKVLNDFLVGRPLPLRPCQYEGLIIATGWNRVPAGYQDEKPVKFEVRLWDEPERECRCNFIARVDRRLKCKYERMRPKPELIMERLRRRVPLFERPQTVPTDHIPERAMSEPGTSPGTPKEYRGTIQQNHERSEKRIVLAGVNPVRVSAGAPVADPDRVERSEQLGRLSKALVKEETNRRGAKITERNHLSADNLSRLLQ